MARCNSGETTEENDVTGVEKGKSRIQRLKNVTFRDNRPDKMRSCLQSDVKCAADSFSSFFCVAVHKLVTCFPATVHKATMRVCSASA